VPRDDESRSAVRHRTRGWLVAAAVIAVAGCAASGAPSTGTGGAPSTGAGGAAAAGGGGGRGGAAGGGGPSALTLLVDADQSSNNDDPGFPPSYSDALFEVALTAASIPYDTLVISPGATWPITTAQLDRYAAVVWYTAGATADLFSAEQQAAIELWLDAGHKTFVVFSENLLSDLGPGGTWSTATDNAFLTTYLGAIGWAAGGDAEVAGTGPVSLEGRLYTVDGAPRSPLAGMRFEIFANTPLESTAGLINPGPHSTVLATVDADPADTGTNSAVPIIVAHVVGTSALIYVGLPVENIDGAPKNTSDQLVRGVLQFAGLL